MSGTEQQPYTFCFQTHEGEDMSDITQCPLCGKPLGFHTTSRRMDWDENCWKQQDEYEYTCGTIKYTGDHDDDDCWVVMGRACVGLPK
jgi:hypothetical protein